MADCWPPSFPYIAIIGKVHLLNVLRSQSFIHIKNLTTKTNCHDLHAFCNTFVNSAQNTMDPINKYFTKKDTKYLNAATKVDFFKRLEGMYYKPIRKSGPI